MVSSVPCIGRDPLGVVDGASGGAAAVADKGVWRKVVSQVERLKNRFLVLCLVLDDHSEHVTVPYQGIRWIQVGPPHNLQCFSPHLVDVLECFVSIEQGKVTTRPARIVEGVVHLVESRIVGRPSVELAQQPQLFEVADMAEVPHQRAHDRVMLAVDVVVGQGSEHLLGAVAVVLESGLQLAARLFG